MHAVPGPREGDRLDAELLALRAAYAAWLEALPDTLVETPTAEALQAIVDLDAPIDVPSPLLYGRD